MDTMKTCDRCGKKASPAYVVSGAVKVWRMNQPGTIGVPDLDATLCIRCAQSLHLWLNPARTSMTEGG
jgi:hypothetical protein